MSTERKGRGWLVGCLIQMVFGGLIVTRGCSAMASAPPTNGSYAAGSLVGILFGAVIFFLGLRGLDRYRRSRE